MDLRGLMRVMYDPASYADVSWLAKAGCAACQSPRARNRLLIQRLVLDCNADPQWLEAAALTEFIDNWSWLRDAGAVLGLLALKAELLRGGYIRWLASETLELLALPIRLPILPGRPPHINQKTISQYGAGYVMTLAQDLPRPLVQRLALVFPVGEASAATTVMAAASTHFVFRLAVEHVKKYRVEARRPIVRGVDQAQGFAAAPGQRESVGAGEEADETTLQKCRTAG